MCADVSNIQVLWVEGFKCIRQVVSVVTDTAVSDDERIDAQVKRRVAGRVFRCQ